MGLPLFALPVPLTEFTLFPKLIPDIRILIWAHAAKFPRSAILFCDTPHDIANLTFRAVYGNPGILHACHESRCEAILRSPEQHLITVLSGFDQQEHNLFYFDNTKDTLILANDTTKKCLIELHLGSSGRRKEELNSLRTIAAFGSNLQATWEMFQIFEGTMSFIIPTEGVRKAIEWEKEDYADFDLRLQKVMGMNPLRKWTFMPRELVVAQMNLLAHRWSMVGERGVGPILSPMLDRHGKIGVTALDSIKPVQSMREINYPIEHWYLMARFSPLR